MPIEQLVCCSVDEFRSLWDWSPAFALLHSDDPETRWFAAHSIALLFGMSGGASEEASKRLVPVANQRCRQLAWKLCSQHSTCSTLSAAPSGS